VRVAASGACYDVGASRLVGPISVELEPGHLLAIVGPNGAGKSTLLRLLGGDLHPTAGMVTFDGADASRMPVGDLARRRAILGHSQTEDVAFTVDQVIGMGRYAHRDDPSIGPAKDRAAVDTAIESLDLRGLENRLVASLSGGERQRTALARILAQDAPLVLLDEPTTALDIGHQQMILRIMRGLAARGHEVVAVLHDLNMAAEFEQVVLLSRGSVSAAGTADVVLTSQRLSDVYGYPIQVVDHPLRSGGLVVPQPNA
jgi:iron complex transport system ATP-binding protein